MAKKKPKRSWVWAPRKPAPPRVPDDLKAEVEARANALIDEIFKPTYLEPPPKDPEWNYRTGFSTKWHRSFFYFVSHYASPGPHALSPTFEMSYTRLGYVGGGRFNLAYFRHTGKWWEVGRGLTLDDAFEMIRKTPIFHPV